MVYEHYFEDLQDWKKLAVESVVGASRVLKTLEEEDKGRIFKQNKDAIERKKKYIADLNCRIEQVNAELELLNAEIEKKAIEFESNPVLNDIVDKFFKTTFDSIQRHGLISIYTTACFGRKDREITLHVTFEQYGYKPLDVFQHQVFIRAFIKQAEIYIHKNIQPDCIVKSAIRLGGDAWSTDYSARTIEISYEFDIKPVNKPVEFLKDW